MRVIPKLPHKTKQQKIMGKIFLFLNVDSFKLSTLLPAMFNSFHTLSSQQWQTPLLHCWKNVYFRAIYSRVEKENISRELNLASWVREEAIPTLNHSFWPYRGNGYVNWCIFLKETTRSISPNETIFS